MQSESSGEPKIVAETGHGAMYRPIHVERRVTIYPIEEHELESLADAQNNATLWASIGTGAATLFASCLWEASVAKESLPIASYWFGGSCIAVAFAGFLLSYRYRTGIQGRLSKILKESAA